MQQSKSTSMEKKRKPKVKHVQSRYAQAKQASLSNSAEPKVRSSVVTTPQKKTTRSSSLLTPTASSSAKSRVRNPEKPKPVRKQPTTTRTSQRSNAASKPPTPSIHTQLDMQRTLYYQTCLIHARAQHAFAQQEAQVQEDLTSAWEQLYLDEMTLFQATQRFEREKHIKMTYDHLELLSLPVHKCQQQLELFQTQVPALGAAVEEALDHVPLSVSREHADVNDLQHALQGLETTMTNCWNELQVADFDTTVRNLHELTSHAKFADLSHVLDEVASTLTSFHQASNTEASFLIHDIQEHRRTASLDSSSAA